MEEEQVQELEEIRKEFEEIKKSNFTPKFKNIQLVRLMNLMEDVFRIPWLLKDAERETPKEVLTLYQEISYARDFDAI